MYPFPQSNPPYQDPFQQQPQPSPSQQPRDRDQPRDPSQSPLSLRPIGAPLHFTTGQFTGKHVRAELIELQKADLGRKFVRHPCALLPSA